MKLLLGLILALLSFNLYTQEPHKICAELTDITQEMIKISDSASSSALAGTLIVGSAYKTKYKKSFKALTTATKNNFAQRHMFLKNYYHYKDLASETSITKNKNIFKAKASEFLIKAKQVDKKLPEVLKLQITKSGVIKNVTADVSNKVKPKYLTNEYKRVVNRITYKNVHFETVNDKELLKSFFKHQSSNTYKMNHSTKTVLVNHQKFVPKTTAQIAKAEKEIITKLAKSSAESTKGLAMAIKALGQNSILRLEKAIAEKNGIILKRLRPSQLGKVNRLGKYGVLAAAIFGGAAYAYSQNENRAKITAKDIKENPAILMLLRDEEKKDVCQIIKNDSTVKSAANDLASDLKVLASTEISTFTGNRESKGQLSPEIGQKYLRKSGSRINE